MIPTGFNAIFLRKIVLASLERGIPKKRIFSNPKGAAKTIEAIKYFRCWRLQINESGMVEGQILLLLVGHPYTYIKIIRQ
jgi:hypothetical protein